jgi:glucose-1-phosphate adenylyltransferase
MVADGCEIQGEIENSILFRGVKVGKGSKVRNSILLQDTVVGDNVELDHVVTDKGVTITSSRSLRGSESFPVYIDKGKKI